MPTPNHSPEMSQRSNPVPINKSTSSESVCKVKEDRVRNNNNSFKFKQRNDNGNTSKQFPSGKNYRNNGNAKSQFCNHQKQPPPRTWAGKRTKITPEQRGEMGGRKPNLNHLLNFTYETEEGLRSATKVYSKSKGIKKAALYNKEKFIQANCQFIVKEGESYSEHAADVDLAMDWDNVEKVNIWKVEAPVCPICLSDFCAARITRCGHIYCWPCILHYLALDDRSWRKCPICHEAVHKKDLKSVSVHSETSYSVQSVITMRLMKRSWNSTAAVVARNQICDDHYQLNNKASVLEQRSRKYLVADPLQVLEHIVNVDKAQLEFKLATETDEFERTFVSSALDLCGAREKELLEAISVSKKSVVSLTDALNDESVLAKNEVSGADVSHDDGAKFESAPGKDWKLKTDGDVDDEVAILNNNSEVKSQSDKDFYYFYQASDGQHIYLHPLNARCLVHQYGSYDKCPDEVSAKILESEEITVDETTRKRYLFLSHLPLSLEFHMAELDLRPPTVSMATLAAFRDAFDRRAGIRRKKARDEKRILRKAQNEALRKQGKYPAAHIHLENEQHFPQIQQLSASGSFSVLLPSPGTTPGNESLISSASELSLSPPSSAASATESGPSFAQMLKASKPDEQFNVVRQRTTAWPVQPMTSSTSQDLEDDDYVAPPTYQSSFGDALCSALHGVEPRSATKKGKKKKKVLLFSTNSKHR